MWELRLFVQNAIIFNSGKKNNIVFKFFLPSQSEHFRRKANLFSVEDTRYYSWSPWKEVCYFTAKPWCLNQYFSKLYLRIGAAENEEGTPFRDRCYLLLHVEFWYSAGTWACWYLWFILLVFFIFTYFKLNILFTINWKVLRVFFHNNTKA